MNFKNQSLAIFNKGHFEPINREFLAQTTSAIVTLLKIQEEFKKLDNDTFFNEYKDSLIASYLNFELINTQKHGFDANIYIEVKLLFMSMLWFMPKIRCNRRFLLCQIVKPIKNNPAAIQTLLKYGYTATIDNIARLRLEILDNRHQYEQVQQSLF